MTIAFTVNNMNIIILLLNFIKLLNENDYFFFDQSHFFVYLFKMIENTIKIWNYKWIINELWMNYE
jgi:hypothetical protein